MLDRVSDLEASQRVFADWLSALPISDAVSDSSGGVRVEKAWLDEIDSTSKVREKAWLDEITD